MVTNDETEPGLQTCFFKELKMIKRLLFLIVFISSLCGKAQCPQVFDYLGNPSSNPYWLSCSGSTLYTLNFQAPTSWGPYTIIWGDGNPNQVAGAYVANSIITHTYTSLVPDTFVVKLIIPSLNCTLTGVVVMEKPVNASMQIPLGGITTGCAPAIMSFINSSTDVSKTTHFQWNFGDGSPLANFTFTNAGQTVSHVYLPGTVNCQTSVTLKAWNYCSQGNTTIATYNPIQIYDLDVAAITPDKITRCWPDNVFTFTNTTARNCVPQGNTFQRQEYWNFGNYWGMPGDSIYNWRPWPPTLPITIAYPAIGTYSIMLRDSDLCGVSVSIININIVNPPTAGVIAPAGPLCQNVPLTFTNSSSLGVSYMWNWGTGGGFVNLGPGNKTNIFALPGTYTVQVAAFVPGGGASCSSTANVVVTILPSPSSNFTNNPSFGCSVLNNVVFNDLSGGAVAWNWNFGNLNTSTLQVPPTQNYTTTGTYTASLIVTSINGCTNTKTTTINVYPNPVANFSPSSTCVGSVTNFTNTSTVTGTNAITSFTWDFGDGSPNNFTQNPVHTYTAPAVYSVQLTVATAFCSGSITKTISVNVTPTADFIYSPTVGCTPSLINFTNTSISATSYLWKFGTVPTATSNATNPSFTYTNGLQVNQIFTVTLIAQTGAGCSDSIKKNVTVFPKPVANFTANLVPGCSPLPLTFTNNTIGATTYSWNFGDGNSSIATNPVHTYTNNSLLLVTNTVQLVATNSLGCTDSYTQTITIFPQPFFSFTMIPASGCTPLSISFPPVLGAVSYTWNFGDGSPLSNSPNPTHIFTNTLITNQTYTVTLMASNAFGCLDTTYGFPVIFTKPTANFTPTPNSGCSPLAINFTNTSVGNTGSAWDFNNGQNSVGTNPTMTFTNVPGSAATTYSVKLVVVNGSNCFDSIIKPVNLFATPKALFNVDTPACAPKVLTFTNTSLGANTYSWNFGDGGLSGQSNPTHPYINNGNLNLNFTITLRVFNVNNCKDSILVPISIHPAAHFSIVAKPDSGCATLKVNFSPIAGAQQYQWTFGDGNVASTASVSNSFVNGGLTTKVYTVSLIVKNQFGCADTPKKIIKVFPKPTALFQADPLTVFVPNQSTSFFNLSSGGTIFTWNFGDGTNSSDNSPSHTYETPGEYSVILIAANNAGCKDTFQLPDKIIALEEPTVQVPNAFTPNGNGSPGNTFDPRDKSNDIFHPNLKGVDKYNLSIYSRWGELLFETKATTEGWDGYYKGKLCIQDVYVWKITATFIDGKRYSKTGDLLLLR